MYRIPLVFTPQPEGGYTVTSPVLPELHTEGNSLDEAQANVRDAFEAVVELYADQGRSMPACICLPGKGEVVWSETLVGDLRCSMIDYKEVFGAIVADARYLKNLDWGEARPGHPEGTGRAHIAEIEPNLEKLRHKLSKTDYWKLKILIHTHDSFKAESQPGVAITDPKSHASLARAFLAEFCDDADLLTMVQFHDEPFALWRQVEAKGKYNQERFAALLSNIQDWSLFLAFNIIDGCTEGKSREPLVWLFKEVAGKVESVFTVADIV